MVWLKGIKPKTPTAVVLVGTGLLLIGVVLHIISMSTDYYAALSASDTKDAATGEAPQINYGLWRFCVELKSNETSCYTFGTVVKNKSSPSVFTTSNLLDTPQWLVSSQVLSIVSVIVAGSGVVAAISWIFTDLGCCVNLLLGVATCSSVIGGVLVLASDIVFAAKYTVDFYQDIGVQRNIFSSAQFKTLDDRLDFGWSFGLDIASGILCILATIPLLMISIFKLDTKQRRSSKNDELIFVSESAGHDRL
ncbi:unnamed protein product [Lymnaea stagnalis]|uniref:Uncharacterized protein n=1 Tax=Lymnaea stagnalis TaxID=6523 RepID=A0AAV2HM77_LYMST